MSNQRVFDSVDTPARNRQNWPSLADFHYLKTILKWRDISTGIFKILDRFERGEEPFYGKKGLILKLESFKGTIFFVWAPGILVLALEQDKDAKFIYNLGLKVHPNGFEYFDLKLC